MIRFTHPDYHVGVHTFTYTSSCILSSWDGVFYARCNILTGATLFIIRIYTVVPEASSFLSNASKQTLALTTTIPMVRQLSRKLIS